MRKKLYGSDIRPLLEGVRQARQAADGPKWRTVHSYFQKWREPGPDGIGILERALELWFGLTPEGSTSGSWGLLVIEAGGRSDEEKPVTEEQIVGILKQQEAGVKTAGLCREHGISAATFNGWKSKFGGMEVSEAQRLKAMEDENRRLKLLVAELSLHGEALKAVIRKNGWSFPV